MSSTKEYMAAYNRAYYVAHREDLKTRAAAYRQANLERVRRRQAAWRVANRDRLKVYFAGYHRANADKKKAAVDAWRATNPDRLRLMSKDWRARRRARMAKNGIEEVDLRRVIARDGMVCHLCGGPVGERELSFDHVIPIAKGGPHSEANLRVAHHRCNARRGAREIGP